MKRLLKDYPEITIKSEDLTGEVDFEDIFGRRGPIHIEIGSGKGTFLVSQAKNNPDVNFLAIERANKYYRFTVDRIGRWSLKNVRLIRTDAAVFLAENLPRESVDCFHIYFPDPWPKKRHNRRRILKQENFALLLKALKVGGIIRIATDNEDYFLQTNAIIKQYSSLLEEIDFTPATGAKGGEITGTNYERKYLNDKRQLFTIAVRKS
jgi:tRNA (guanine-N7-)-methyltransferase